MVAIMHLVLPAAWQDSAWRRDRGELLASAILICGVGYTIVAFPTFELVDCLRSGPLALKVITILWDSAFFVAYSWIPVRLVLTWLGLKVRPGELLLVLYGMFIVLCGLVHLGLVLVFEWPYYWALAKLKALGGAVSLAVAYVTEKKHPDLLALGDQGDALRKATDRAERLHAQAAERAARLERMQGDLLERAAAEAAARNQAEGLAFDLAAALKEKDAEIAKNAELLVELNLAKDLANQRAIRAEGAAGTATAERDDAQKHNDELKALTDELQRALAEGAAATDRVQLQAAAIRELETPVTPLWDGVLFCPIVGPMDSSRARRLMQTLLDACVAHGARVVIVDVTGVSVIDTAVAEALTTTAKAVKLIGSECVITGISGAIATTIVKLGLEIGIKTRRDVQQGLSLAMRRIKQA